MSKTMLVFLIAIGVGVGLSRKHSANAAAAATTSGNTTTTEGVEAVPAKPSTLGKIGVRLVEGTVLRMSANTQYTLQTLGPALKRADGAHGRRAKEAAKTATDLDKASHEALKRAHPIEAVRAAIDARNYVNVTKGILKNGP